MNKTLIKFAALGLLAATAAMPAISSAQSYRQHRDQKKNEWKNIGIGAAAVGVYGLLKGDTKLAILGGAGAAYSAYRYDQDGKASRNGRYDRYGYDRNGYDQYGYGRNGYDRNGRSRSGYDTGGYGSGSYGNGSYDRGDYNRDDYNRGDRNRDDYNRGSWDSSYNRGNHRSQGPGNSDWGHSHARGNSDWGHSRHKRHDD